MRFSLSLAERRRHEGLDELVNDRLVPPRRPVMVEQS